MHHPPYSPTQQTPFLSPHHVDLVQEVKIVRLHNFNHQRIRCWNSSSGLEKFAEKSDNLQPRIYKKWLFQKSAVKMMCYISIYELAGAENGESFHTPLAWTATPMRQTSPKRSIWRPWIVHDCSGLRKKRRSYLQSKFSKNATCWLGHLPTKNRTPLKVQGTIWLVSVSEIEMSCLKPGLTRYQTMEGVHVAEGAYHTWDGRYPTNTPAVFEAA